MWQQLALAAAKSLQDNQNRQNDIASNVITQKYSPWTGARADFSSQGKNNTISNLMAGYGSGLLQDRMDEMWEAQRPRTPEEQKAAQDKADGEYYAKLSADPASVGASPITGKSSFAAIARQAPAQAPQSSPAPMAKSDVPGEFSEEPYIFANRAPSSFLSQIGVNEEALKQSMAQTPAQQSINPWANLSQQLQRPLTPQEAQAPEAPVAQRFDPTAANRSAVGSAFASLVPEGSPLRDSLKLETPAIYSGMRNPFQMQPMSNEQPRIYSPMQFPVIGRDHSLPAPSPYSPMKFPKINPVNRRPF